MFQENCHPGNKQILKLDNFCYKMVPKTKCQTWGAAKSEIRGLRQGTNLATDLHLNHWITDLAQPASESHYTALEGSSLDMLDQIGF